jgi:hypothetical protein
VDAVVADASTCGALAVVRFFQYWRPGPAWTLEVTASAERTVTTVTSERREVFME